MDEIVIAPEANRKKIIFVFHGYGADNENLLPIGRAFSQCIESVEVRLPNGIEPCNEG
jgi:predicted esterase